MVIFLVWSAVYWGCERARRCTTSRARSTSHISMVGAFATMGVVGVGIMLPNSPGLVGQFQYFMLLGAGLYLGFDPRVDYALTASNHGMGVRVLHAALPAAGRRGTCCAWARSASLSPWVSFHDLRIARKKVDPDAARR